MHPTTTTAIALGGSFRFVTWVVVFGFRINGSLLALRFSSLPLLLFYSFFLFFFSMTAHEEVPAFEKIYERIHLIRNTKAPK